MKPICVGRIPIGDVDDPEIFAGFAIADWEKTKKSKKLKEYRMYPTVWKIGLVNMHHHGYTVDLWCEEYQDEDLMLAQLAGLIPPE